MTTDDFITHLAQLVGEAEDGGVEHHELISALECAAAAIRDCEAE